MNFFIKQNSTLPFLTMEVVENGVNSHKKFYEDIQNADITFFMEEIGSCIPYLQCAECCLISDNECESCHEKIYVQYKWKNGDTNKKGNYRGWFEFYFIDSQETLIVPIKEELFIKII